MDEFNKRVSKIHRREMKKFLYKNLFFGYSNKKFSILF